MTLEDDVFSQALAHGRKYENVAIDQYENAKAVSVDRSGIFVDLQRPYLGCSPDGLVGEERIVEIKCPYTAKGTIVSPESVPYIELDEVTGLYRLNAVHDYMYQIQGLLHITNRPVCDFVVFTISDMLIIEITKEAEFIQQMLNKLDTFYFNFFQPHYLRRYFFRNTDSYNFE